jgi:resuscitation-promoting factor RpfB
VRRRLRALERLGVAVGILALLGCAPPETSTGRQPVAEPVAGSSDATTAEATGSPTPAPQTTTPALEKRVVTQTQPIPFPHQTVDDPSLPQGTRKVRTAGVNGEKTLTYEVTYSGGVQVDRKLVGESVTRAPVAEVVAVGTKPASKCDPNYSGACVPIGSDVDCAGGSGDGPAYVRGPVRVVGTDIYRLDNDHDGVGCE